MNMESGGHASASNNSRFSLLSDGGGGRERGFEAPAPAGIVSVIHVTWTAQLSDAHNTQALSSWHRDGPVQGTLWFLLPSEPLSPLAILSSQNCSDNWSRESSGTR